MLRFYLNKEEGGKDMQRKSYIIIFNTLDGNILDKVNLDCSIEDIEFVILDQEKIDNNKIYSLVSISNKKNNKELRRINIFFNDALIVEKKGKNFYVKSLSIDNSKLFKVKILTKYFKEIQLNKNIVINENAIIINNNKTINKINKDTVEYYKIIDKIFANKEYSQKLEELFSKFLIDIIEGDN